MKTLLMILYCIIYAVLNVIGSSTIKYALIGKQLISFQDYFQFMFQPRVLLGFLSIFLSALVMFKALSEGKFSFVVPLSVGINFILTVIVGTSIFNDKLNAISYIGLSLILSGIILMSLKPVA